MKRTLADKARAECEAAKAEALSPDRLIALLRKKRHTTEQLCKATGGTEQEVKKAIRLLQQNNVLLYLFGNEWGIEKAPAPSIGKCTYVSREDDTYLFGVVSDTHLGSKYERLDCLKDLYDWFAAEGVDRVFHGGNWIDGESRFNMHDLHTHGMDNQLDYLADVYPNRPGIVTYAVAGDDHEGWYSQREGVDIGKHAERVMRDAGRDDWVNLGYMECFISLVNAHSKKSNQLLLMHAGGGSAYALSYVVQKIVEHLDGGEKPAVLIPGHYHKLWTGNIRNVWCLLPGCTKDQGPWDRKKRISQHIGGLVVKLTQDRKTGAIVRCRPEMKRYFNRGFYNDRWSHAGKVTLPERDWQE